jgi:hypothetical protein
MTLMLMIYVNGVDDNNNGNNDDSDNNHSMMIIIVELQFISRRLHSIYHPDIDINVVIYVFI